MAAEEKTALLITFVQTCTLDIVDVTRCMLCMKTIFRSSYEILMLSQFPTSLAYKLVNWAIEYVLHQTGRAPQFPLTGGPLRICS